MIQANTFKAKLTAADLVKNLGIVSPDQISIEDIAMARGVYVREGTIAGADSWLIRQGKSGLIRVSSSIPMKGRKRFAIGHELGHWELHQGLSQAFLCVEGDLAGYTRSAPEIEANVFSSELLMPSALYGPLCQRGDPDLEVVYALSDIFQTTRTASAMRFVEETKHTCVLIFSDSGSVCWWKKKESWKDFWIEVPDSIPEFSFAHDCLTRKCSMSRMRNVDPKLWLGNLPDDKSVEVHEQSTRLGDNPWVLTLLWIICDDREDDGKDMCEHYRRKQR